MKSTALPRNLQDWLNRRPKVKTPRKPIPKATKSRAAQVIEYRKIRKAYLKVNPACESGPLLWPMAKCSRVATDIHHMRGRIGAMLTKEAYFLPVCRTCHCYIHDNPKDARELHLLQ